MHDRRTSSTPSSTAGQAACVAVSGTDATAAEISSRREPSTSWITGARGAEVVTTVQWSCGRTEPSSPAADCSAR